ncbi:hypothetical protein Bca4012_059042 [Brassica carinata]
MGTVDPTGKLKEDKVCVILHASQSLALALFEFSSLNPGLQFGVFFPQKGPRSLGDEIAGSDFDGDMYFFSRIPELHKNFKPSEPVSDFYKEKCGQWYDNYRKEMFQALRDKDESASEVIRRHKQEKDESASEVIERYKQEFYGAAGFEDSKKSLKELYLQALGLYNIVYDYAIEKEKVGYCGFVWKEGCRTGAVQVLP